LDQRQIRKARCPGELGETTRRSRKVGKAGRPAEQIVGDTERPEEGATLRSASRHRRRMRDSRQLENSITGKSRRCEPKGNRRPASEATHGGVRETGETRRPSQNQRRGSERDSGRLEDQSPAQPKDDEAGQLAESLPERPKDAERGNSRTHCWRNWKMQGTGQPDPDRMAERTIDDPTSYIVSQNKPWPVQSKLGD